MQAGIGARIVGKETSETRLLGEPKQAGEMPAQGAKLGEAA